MRNCKRCGGNKSPQAEILVTSRLSIDDSLPSVEVYFKHHRILQSQVTQERLKTVPGENIRVYVSDLVFWIRNGVKGIAFKELSDEVDFIDKNGIVPAQYA